MRRLPRKERRSEVNIEDLKIRGYADRIEATAIYDARKEEK